MRTTLPSGTPAEVARPAGPADRGLVIAPDIMGLRPLYDEMVASVAAEHGWPVAAVEPFPDSTDATLEDRKDHLTAQLDDGAVLADLAAAADLLEVDTVGLIGFCMGGMYALKASAWSRFDRCVAFYGMIRLPEAWRGPGQGEPLDAVRGRRADVLAVIGDLDPYTPPEDVADLEATGVRTLRFADAEHGFVHDPDRPAHRPDDAAAAWSEAFAFLRGDA